MENGYLDVSPGCEDSYHSVTEAIQKLGSSYSRDALIAKLTFGFWAYQFSRKEFAAAGSTLLQIFPNRPHGTPQKEVFKNLIRINDTRNRIAHYEPICFDKITGTVSSAQIQRRYELILEMIRWLGYDPRKMLYGVDGVKKVLQEMNRL